MVYVFLAEGFEPIEAVTPIDMLRRAGIDVSSVSIGESQEVKASRDITVLADMMFSDACFSDAEMLILPGGPGTHRLEEHAGLCSLLRDYAASGKPIAAICAAPSVLGHLGLLDGRRATVYPGCGDGLDNVCFTGRFVEQDGNFITAAGPAASFEFGAAIIGYLRGSGVRESVCGSMLANCVGQQR